MKAIYGLFIEPDEVQRAVDGLRAVGLADRDIVIVSSEPIEEYEFSRRDQATWLHWIAGGGGAAGMLVAYLLTSFTERAWPLPTGNMPIVPMWPNLIVFFELTMLGGIVATVVTFVVTAKIPARESRLYDPEVSDGKILVGVENPPPALTEAMQRTLTVAGAGRLVVID